MASRDKRRVQNDPQRLDIDVFTEMMVDQKTFRIRVDSMISTALVIYLQNTFYVYTPLIDVT